MKSVFFLRQYLLDTCEGCVCILSAEEKYCWSLIISKGTKINPLIHNVPKWSDTHLKSCSICCKIFKVCLTILGHYALKG